MKVLLALLFSLVVGFFTTVFLSDWLANRTVVFDRGLSHVDLGARGVVLTDAGWMFFTLVFAGVVLAVVGVPFFIGWLLGEGARWANGQPKQ